MTFTLRPMTAAELAARTGTLIEEYALDLHRSRNLPLDRARAEARRQSAELLPDGVDTDGALLFTAVADGVAVGWVWISLPAPDRPDTAWIYEITVDPEHRGNGHGRATMRAAEDELARRGVPRLALNVFGDNTAAIRLYESLGFRTTSMQMAKPVEPRP
ncbi:N-acetyltransferase family protein [Planosporangium sp. 12N6]|uniref:GNAT family N-acetyltransferase n=1 Tax=Planosporangium spinosum TaxID=3402278 RepID=UPI003CECDCD6